MAIIIPQVFADAVNEKLGFKLKVGALATNYTEEVGDITVMGNEVHFPQLKRTVTAGEVTKGTALVPNEVDMEDAKATIKQVGASARVYDKDAKQIKGSVLEKMVEQVVDAMVVKLDTDLIAEIDTNATKKLALASATAITSDEINNALGLFGDDIDTESFGGIVINSRLVASFYGMNAFVDSTKTFNGQNDNGIVKNGVIGFYMGIPVIVSNHDTYDTSKSECKTYIIKKGALGYVLQEAPTVEEARQALLFATDIVSGSLYAVHVMDADGIVVARKTIA